MALAASTTRKGHAVPTRWRRLLAFPLLLWFNNVFVISAQDLSDPQDLAHPHADSCAWTGGSCEWDYNMQAMTAEFENQQTSTFFAYVEPDVSTYYNQPEGTRQLVDPDFEGLFAKFINLSPKSIQVMMIKNNKNNPPVYICDIEPFGSAGTATYPDHTFQVTLTENTEKVLTTFKTVKGQNLYPYEPYKGNYGKAYKKMTKDQFQKYMLQHNNLLFARQYKKKTGRDWLALYGQRFPPRYHMWQAESFGQTHTITTKQTHFVESPPQEELAKGTSLYGPRPDEITRNRKYRDTLPTMNLTLEVLSCSPRVFEIANFLSDVEVDHILQVAQEQEADSESMATEQESSPRTSTNNTWVVGRHQSIMLDAIYRRAADVMQIDEKFFRYRRPLEVPEFDESKVSISENLQLVHYDVGEQSTPHHDFSIPGLVRGQPARYATLLLYLNDDMEGGETSFPLWRNAETSHSLWIKPKKGKAVLFYNLLPDGNFDELAEHEALPVTKGEKWLANLWIWDPVLAHA